MVEQIMLHHYLVASLWYPLRFFGQTQIESLVIFDISLLA